ncbi:MAG: preprotein translocase subunit SecE [Intestinibacillus sp.]
MADQEKGHTPAEKKQADKPVKAKKPSIFSRIEKWFRELKSEIRKIVWPTRKQTTNNSIVVISAILVIGVYIWVLDAICNLGIQTLLQHFA